MEPTERVYRLQARQDHPGLWEVLGLNIFDYNEPPGVDQFLPMKEWLSFLLGEEPAAVLVGGCAIQDIGWPHLPNPIRVDTTILAGEFYSFSKESQNKIPGVLYPQIDRTQLFAELIGEYLRYDAVAIMARVRDQQMLTSVLNDFTNEDSVRMEILKLADWMVLTQGDAQFLQSWSLIPQAEAEILRCCDVADQAVRNVPWFKKVMPQLHWLDSELCYGLPRPSRYELKT
jgi:hypothetical protein